MAASDKYLTRQEIAVVDALSLTISALSVVGCVFMLACYVRYVKLRKFAFTLVAILSATDFAAQILNFVSPSGSDLEAMATGRQPVSALCYTQAIGDSFFELSSVLWTSAIAETLYVSVVWRLRPEQVAALLPRFAAVCLGLPALLAALPALDVGAYGPAGGWCWITEEKQYWRYIQFYVPLWLAIAFNGFVYVKVWRLLHRTAQTAASLPSAGALPPSTPHASARASAADPPLLGGQTLAPGACAGGAAGEGGGEEEDPTAVIRRLMRRLSIYPFILVIVWFFPTVNRIYESLTGGDQVFGLYLLQRTFSCSQGLLNALAYGFSPGIREALRADAARYLPRLWAALGWRPHTSMQALIDDADASAAVTPVRGGGGSSFSAAHGRGGLASATAGDFADDDEEGDAEAAGRGYALPPAAPAEAAGVSLQLSGVAGWGGGLSARSATAGTHAIGSPDGADAEGDTPSGGAARPGGGVTV